ncbi:hypothetical protein [uncultured Sulfitobacter sp.]|uniref:COG3904 family protein n=1 Tax=uncultured Sulfitobacter sp. TaxID=191468 RepID=UPI00260C63DA|nr:hypothetical protein [uncultured Sulfitobacter sp.]
MRVANALFCAFFLQFLSTSAFAQNAEHPNYPVIIVDEGDGIIAIADEIDSRTPLAFERTLSEVPNASVLILDSPGGAVHGALAIATRVHGLGMATVVLSESKCFSACALVFFAGAERLAFGELGVHQISPSNGRGDMVGGQFALADVLEALNDYDVPSEVIGVMLRTPPESMYVFSASENRRYGFLNETEPQTASPEPRPKTVDLANPETWRGKVITGQLVSSGKKWYASLNKDGTTIFQFTSGQVSSGRYYLSESEVCFQLDQNPEFACRRPVPGPAGVRWYDEDGGYQSLIVSVDNARMGAIVPRQKTVNSISDHILPGDCALIVASRPTISEARDYVLSSVTDRRYLKAFRSRNGWIAISIGTLKAHEVDAVVSKWKKSGRIPKDSYCSTGSNYEAVVSLGLQ